MRPQYLHRVSSIDSALNFGLLVACESPCDGWQIIWYLSSFLETKTSRTNSYLNLDDQIQMQCQWIENRGDRENQSTTECGIKR